MRRAAAMVLAVAVSQSPSDLAWAGRARAGIGMGTIEESYEVKHARAKEQAVTYY